MKNLSAGSKTFRVYAAPVGVEDCRPGNNSDGVGFNVKAVQDLKPPDSKVDVEIISGS
ncbi:MAG: hypothetical protein H5T97_11955 [Firmicutes bacterium]|nr:hypothetical protein [Bacillota bacterium]